MKQVTEVAEMRNCILYTTWQWNQIRISFGNCTELQELLE